ncbi:MAG: hypothetical protein ABIC91_02410 [Nanoarchaeota archaeon]|nr:hypothetical protein [Nanoarchaeota archaeon]MBU1030109.1 hypothetical protein [Nanoarchaeota archaeon]MBU1849992.1 hypothetical protein [Nanoarchaeota archaeon]
MSFNQVENGVLVEAINHLNEQYHKKYPQIQDNLRLGKGEPRLMIIKSGPDKGKLTVVKEYLHECREHSNMITPIPDENIKPINCYNLINSGECIADAFQRLIVNKEYTPY